MSWSETLIMFFVFQVTCTKCNTISNNYANIFDLEVQIQDVESLEECLDQFTCIEWLDGENMYKCARYVPNHLKTFAKSIRLTCMWRGFWWFHNLYFLLLAQWTGFMNLVDWNICLLNQSSAMIDFTRSNSSSVDYMGLELEVYLQFLFGGVSVANGPWPVLRNPVLQIFAIATWIKLRFAQS